MDRADIVLTMTRGHRAAILAAYPDRAHQVRTLRRDGGDIADPVGSSVEVYRQCAEQIEQELRYWIENLPPTFLPVEQKPSDGADDQNGSQESHDA